MSADYKAAAKVAEEITNAPLFSREVRNLAAAHLELLARLDEAAGRIFGPGVFADAAAAIRELEAKLEAALAPERTAAGQQPWLIRTCNHEWFEGRCVHCNVKAVDGRAAPASPLLPGREREVTLRMSFIEWMCGEREHPDTGAWFDRPEGAGAFWWRKAIRAEISRLNGEGRGS